MREKNLDVILQGDKYHIPRVCKKCRGVMIFKGVGEYHCELCDAVDYDDYGKVRLFLESNPGANAMQIEMETGVSQQTTRMLLKEGRLEVTPDSKTFLHCELCGKAIRSGTYCPECEIKVHRSIEEKQREMLKKDFQIIGMGETGDDGRRRFTRNRE